jgi:hypothetical protein
MDYTSMADGDRAGLAVFRDRSAYIGVHRAGEKYEVVAVQSTTIDEWNGETTGLGRVTDSVELPPGPEEGGNGEEEEGKKKIWFRAKMDARPNGDRGTRFEYSLNGEGFVRLGGVYELYTG